MLWLPRPTRTPVFPSGQAETNSEMPSTLQLSRHQSSSFHNSNSLLQNAFLTCHQKSTQNILHPGPPHPKKKGYQSTLRKILRIFDALNFTWILPDFHHPAFAIWKPFPLGQSHGKVVPTNQRTLRTSSRAFSSQRKPTQRQHPPNVRPGKAGNTNGDIFFDLLPDIFPSFGKNIQEFEFDEISFSFPWMVLKSSVFLLIFFWDRVLKSLGT